MEDITDTFLVCVNDPTSFKPYDPTNGWGKKAWHHVVAGVLRVLVPLCLIVLQLVCLFGLFLCLAVLTGGAI